MKKNEVIGIILEGLHVQVAHIEKIDSELIIHDLGEFTLDIKTQEEIIPDEKNDNDEKKSTAKTASIDIHELLNEDKEEFKIDDDSPINNNDSNNITLDSTNLLKLNQFLLNYNLDECDIALNANYEDINFSELDPLLYKKNITKIIENKILNSTDKKNNDLGYDYYINSSDVPIITLKRNRLRLVDSLFNYGILLKKKLRIKKIVPNNISFFNLLNLNYQFEEDELTVFLYFGYEHRFGIVLIGNRYHSRFNLSVHGENPEKLIQNTFSKLILEQDTGKIPNGQIDNFFIAGKNVLQSDLDFFREKNFANNIDYVELQNCTIDEKIINCITPRVLAHFLLPISVAISLTEEEMPNNINTNLISKNISDSHKPFKLEWHGYLLLIMIFFLTFMVTYQTMTIKTNIEKETNQKKYLANQLAIVSGETNKIRMMKNKISQLKENISEVDKIMGNRNQWTFILSIFQDYFKKNKLGWLISLESTDNNQTFIAQGYTIDRSEITKIANLFSQSINKEVFREEIQNYQVWKFRITYEFPDKNKRLLSSKKANPPVVKTKVAVKSSPKIDRSQKTTKEIYNEIALRYLDGEYESAYYQFLEFVKKYPNDRLVYSANYLIAEYIFSFDDKEKAIQMFEKLKLKNDHRQPEILFLLTKAYWQTNKPLLSQENYNLMKKTFPNHDLFFELENYLKENK